MLVPLVNLNGSLVAEVEMSRHFFGISYEGTMYRHAGGNMYIQSVYVDDGGVWVRLDDDPDGSAVYRIEYPNGVYYSKIASFP